MREKYIAAMARKYGLDPRAVLADARGEGLSGGVGDGGHAFGPFQMNDAGGVLTNAPASHHSNAWAWSNEGINYALRGMASVARGLHGEAALRAIVSRYERPADIPGAIRTRLSYLHGMGDIPGGQGPAGAHAGSQPGHEGAGSLVQTLMNANAAYAAGIPQGPEGTIAQQESLIQSLMQKKQPGGGQKGPGPAGNIQTGGKIPGFAKIIGTPYTGTHTLGNWESDNAFDIAMPVGTPIRAARSGIIGSQIGALDSSNPRMAGLRLHLVANGQEYYYAHLSKLLVKAGQHVKAGQIIGYSGSANGVAHLHLAERHGRPNPNVRRRVL